MPSPPFDPTPGSSPYTPDPLGEAALFGDSRSAATATRPLVMPTAEAVSLRDLRAIRELVERATTYTNVPGVSGLINGVLALAGVAATIAVCESVRVTDAMIESHLLALSAVWGGVLAVALISTAILARRKARRHGEPLWTTLARQVMHAFAPALGAGGLLTVVLATTGNFTLIPGVWMLAYGLGTASAGMFSVRPVRVLGWAFLLTAPLPLLVMPGLGLVWLAVSFGGYHIVAGAVIARRYGG